MPFIPPYIREREVMLYGLVMHHLNIQAVLVNATNIQQQRIQQVPAQPQCRQRRAPRWWTRDWIFRRPILGQYERLVQELKNEDHESFRNFLRMDPEMYAEVAERVSARLYKPDSR